MSLSLSQLLTELGNAQPGQPISNRMQASPDEIEAAFQALDGIFYFNRFSGGLVSPGPVSPAPASPNTPAAPGNANLPGIQVGGLKVNPAVQLNDRERATAQRLADGFQQHLQAGQIRLVRGPSGAFQPGPMGRETTRSGFANSLAAPGSDAVPPVVFLSNSPGCQWQWWWKVRWWGVRLSLNSCAVNYLTSAGAGVAALMASFGLPALAAAVLSAVLGIIKAFDNGIGVRIYWSWVGVPWVTSKPA